VNQLRASGDEYWATPVDAMLKEAQAWRSATSDSNAAIGSMRAAADEEDA